MKLRDRTRVFLFERHAQTMIRLLQYFEKRPDIEIVAANPHARAFMDEIANYNLRKRIDELRPDVVVVDIKEPWVNDLIWIAKVRELTFAPLIAFTDADVKGGIQYGVRFFDAVKRPADEAGMDAALRMLVFAIRRAKAAQATPPEPLAATTARGEIELIAMGASTGGVEAIIEILSEVPRDMPPILIVQHMARGFAEVFADNISKKSRLKAMVAQNGEEALSGCAYIAPDAMHMTVEKRPGGYALLCAGGEKVSGHMPSVDALMCSVAAQAGNKAIGVLLTGMGRDGATGLKRMRDAGAATIGQDESTSLIYGMPKAAFELGAVERRLPLEIIGRELVKRTHKGDR